MAGTPQYEDQIIRNVFAISLREQDADGTANPPVICLQGLAQELHTEERPLLFGKDTIDRAIMARLLDAPEQYPQWPLHYLIGCYGRATAEIRQISSLRDKDAANRLQVDLQYCKELIASNAGLLLTMADSLFPQPDQAVSQGPLQLLEGLTSSDSSLPAGFLEDLVSRIEPDDLPDLAVRLMTGINQKLLKTSPLGEWSGLLQAILRLTSMKPITRALTQSPAWLGAVPGLSLRADEGRQVLLTLLGPAFALAVLPDPQWTNVTRPEPSVGQQCFSDVQNRRQSDVTASQHSLRLTMSSIVDSLHNISMNFLRNQDTREAMLKWIGICLEWNSKERSKMKMDYAHAAPDSFFINLDAVLLKMCEPFLEPLSGKAWGKVDAGYVTNSTRISFQEETKLNMEAEEEKTYLQQRRASQEGASSSASGSAGATGSCPGSAGAAGNGPSYHFICECFFLTAKGLHLGLSKAITESAEVARELPHYIRGQQEIEVAIQGSSGMELHMLRAQATKVKAHVELLHERKLCFDTVLQEPSVLRNAIAFYRLLATWLMRMAFPPLTQGQMPFVPLPDPTPVQFRCLPEYFVDDLCELMLYVGQHSPKSLEGLQVEEIMTFMVVFMGSPACLKNPFVRSRISEVLFVLLQPQAGENRRRAPVAASVQNLIEGHPMVQQYLVRSLMKLYVDIEFTDRSNAFYEKFSTRASIGQILEDLWSMPAHRESWKALAAGRGPPDAQGAAEGQHVHLQFCNMILNDSTYLLGEALEKLPQIKNMEALMDNQAAWDALSRREQQEKEGVLRQESRVIQTYLSLAVIAVRTVEYSTTEVTSTWLLPEMVLRVANMLNYFLQFLTGPNRRQLKVKNPEKFGWRPKQLLPQLASIYLHLERSDSKGAFAAAIAVSDRYRQDMFPETCQVLRSLGLMADMDIDELENLAQRVDIAKHQGAEDDVEMADAPDDFLDPITYTVMQDPVKLPSGAVMDRPNVLRMLLSDPRDPTTRAPLSEKDLVADTELKIKIEMWKQQRST